LHQLIETMDDLSLRGVELRSLTENIVDATSPSGKLVFGIFALMGEFERICSGSAPVPAWRLQESVATLAEGLRASGPSDLRKAKARLASGDYGKADVARELGVSRYTLSRELAQE
jgi:DNA invertase Pin-like site-specific DNA recombinase